MSHGRDVAKAMCEADILTNLAVDLLMDALVDDGLDTHIFNNVFDGEVKRNTVLVILNQFRLFLEETTLLKEQLFIESDRFYVLLQYRNQLQV